MLKRKVVYFTRHFMPAAGCSVGLHLPAELPSSQSNGVPKRAGMDENNGVVNCDFPKVHFCTALHLKSPVLRRDSTAHHDRGEMSAAELAAALAW